MDKIDEILTNYKDTIGAIEAPIELEAKLRTALEHTSKPKHWYTKGFSVAILLLIMLTAYSYDALAYYSKHLLGYDQVISGSLRDLNQLGKGQNLSKSYTFSDGTEVILDKILFDDNELILLYTEKAKGQVSVMSPTYNRVQIEMRGLFGTYLPQGGTGASNQEGSQMSWAQSYEPPKPLEKWMSFIVSKNVNGTTEFAKISFTLDRNEAITNTIKQELAQSIDVNGKKIDFKNITVTPMSTLVKGKADNLNRDERLTFDLMVNGKKVPVMGGGWSGREFEREFEGISEVHTIEIANIKLVRERMVDLTTSVTTNTKNLEIGAKDDLFVIKEILVKNGNTYLHIQRLNNVEATIGVFNGNEQLKSTVDETNIENSIDTKAKTIEEIREYEGTGDELKILVKVLQTFTPYERNLQVPLE